MVSPTGGWDVTIPDEEFERAKREHVELQLWLIGQWPEFLESVKRSAEAGNEWDQEVLKRYEEKR